MHLHFIADGPRDEDTIPRIVERILGTSFDVSFREWKGISLHRGSGYRRKLRFALLQARDANYSGVVAIVDRDKSRTGDRLPELRAARADDRRNPTLSSIAAVIGEAIPHVEAWLLDDPVAVRDVLRFPNDKVIPGVRRTNPKSLLHDLIVESSRTEVEIELLSEIASTLVTARCNHSSETGLSEFIDDVRAELGPLVSAS